MCESSPRIRKRGWSAYVVWKTRARHPTKLAEGQVEVDLCQSCSNSNAVEVREMSKYCGGYVWCKCARATKATTRGEDAWNKVEFVKVTLQGASPTKPFAMVITWRMFNAPFIPTHSGETQDDMTCKSKKL